ncbi:MAG: hypothetical protein ACOYOA_12785 [Saprospiraceae bacterium]
MIRYILAAVNVIFLMFIGINAMMKDFFSNTFEIQHMIAILSVTGMVVGLLISIFYMKKSEIADGLVRTQLILISVIMSVLFFVIVGINTNYLFAKKYADAQRYLILDIRPFFKTGGGIIKGENITPNGFVVFIEKSGKSQQLRYKSIDNFQNWVGKTAVLDIRKGLLGYDVFVPNPLKE